MEKDLEAFLIIAKSDINRKLKEIIKNHDERIKIEYFLKGGKRLRPLLCLLSFKACGGSEAGYEDALDLAAAIELQHSASLVHDDIIDGDIARRGSSSYYKAYGIEDAILTGHRVIVLGFKNILDHDPKIIRMLFNIWEDSLRGEMKDVEARKNDRSLIGLRGELYFEVILKKTASLFAGAAMVGSQEAKAPKKLQDIFWEYGKYIGLAYQLVDDSQDLDNGKETLPLAWILGQMDDDMKESFIKSMENRSLLPSEILSGLGVDSRSMFLRQVIKMQHAAEGVARSKMIPENEFKPFLLDFPEYVIKKCVEK
ncbi:MAG: polyprenyl synthetase family protein [Candidatus Methanomethylicaceae archaeon]|jgi:geranylgeranyl pyrophosphate synthase